MSQRIHVHLLPSLFEPAEVQGRTVVVVDVLRASTTMTHALANGAKRVVPCLSVEQAIELRAASPPETCLLGGERGGVKIDGFDLSNSPDDYTPDVVHGKTIGFTTTNGTQALLRAHQAKQILVGSFVNLSAIAQRLATADSSIHIVCAGTNGAVTGEDVLFAGALVVALRNLQPEMEVTDAAVIAESHWKQRCGTLSQQVVETALLRSQGGHNLTLLGYQKDVATAAAVDSVPVIGMLDADGSIRVLPE
ncbi:MAG: 2-phosphosulfolactate phosphatase [Planctomycetaceae bacterium]